tara:strand:- start:1295 stop:1717 length:423 start_codon:yes stop_codon:yes gene_type:complete
MKTFKQIREDKFQLVDMDADTARVAVQLAKKAGLKPKSYKSRSGGLDISVEGPKKKVAKFIMSLPESTQVDERAALVMDISSIVKTMLKDVQSKLEKELKKGQTELANNVGRLVGLKITTKGQQKNKAFLYDLEKGFKKK